MNPCLRLKTAFTARMAAAFCVVALLLAGCSDIALFSSRSPQDGSILVSTLDIGHADAHVIQTPTANILIDTGEASSGPAISRWLKARGVKELHLVILTHPHADHIGGFRYLAQNFRIGQVLDSGFPHGSSVQRSTLEAIASHGIPFRKARAGQVLKIDSDLTIRILWPEEPFLRGTASDPNNNSVVLLVQHGAIRLLFPGDLEEPGELRLLARGEELRADYLKVAHQGSKGGTSWAFLQAVRPRHAVIVSAVNNRYGHPSPETLERLKAAGVTIWRTDRDGTVSFVSDGKTLRRTP